MPNGLLSPQEERAIRALQLGATPREVESLSGIQAVEVPSLGRFDTPPERTVPNENLFGQSTVPIPGVAGALAAAQQGIPLEETSFFGQLPSLSNIGQSLQAGFRDAFVGQTPAESVGKILASPGRGIQQIESQLLRPAAQAALQFGQEEVTPVAKEILAGATGQPLPQPEPEEAPIATLLEDAQAVSTGPASSEQVLNVVTEQKRQAEAQGTPAPKIEKPDDIPKSTWEQLNQEFDMTSVGLALLATANNGQGLAANLGTALQVGRQAKQQQGMAKEAAIDKGIARKEALSRITKNLAAADKDLKSTTKGKLFNPSKADLDLGVSRLLSMGMAEPDSKNKTEMSTAVATARHFLQTERALLNEGKSAAEAEQLALLQLKNKNLLGEVSTYGGLGAGEVQASSPQRIDQLFGR